MFKYIKNIIYKKHSMPSLKEYTKVEIGDNKNTLEFVDNVYSNSIQNPKTAVVRNELVIEFVDKLLRTIDGWENEYIGKNIIDGTEWQLKIIFTDGIEKNYRGENAFPYNFEYVDRIKCDFIDKALKEEK